MIEQNLGKAKEYWNYLTDLAKKDPEAYKKHILKQKDRADGHIVESEYYFKYNDSYLNMCSSKAVQEPTDWTNIPILMSKERIIGSEIVYDAVFHPRVMEKAQSDVDFGRDLRDLAKGCVKELYGVDLVEPGVSHPGYFGPYGWNDKNGQSLTGDEIQKQSEIKLKEEEPEIEIKTSLEPKKPVLIEEIVEVPKFVTKWTDRYEITLFLPDVNKQDIVTKTLGSKLTVQAGKYQWEHQLPSNVDPNEPQCKFVNSKLKLKFSRV